MFKDLCEKSPANDLDSLAEERMKSNDALVTAFDEEMLGIYQRALSEAKYPATRFLHMLHEHRGVETAKILINADNVSEDYTAPWERKRLDLTVEAVIHDNEK